MSRGPACRSQLPPQPCAMHSDLLAPAAAAPEALWGPASPRPAHITPFTPCPHCTLQPLPMQAAPRSEPTAGRRAHTLLPLRKHVHRHTCMHMHAQLHSCTLARTHMHTSRLAEPMHRRVPGDSCCHCHGTRALFGVQDAEGPRLLWLRVPKALPDPI